MLYGTTLRLVALASSLFAISVFIPISLTHAVSSAPVPNPYYYTFNDPGTLYEAGSMSQSSSGYWWLNSGGKLVINGGVGGTVHGSLLSGDYWSSMYKSSSPTDTDGGKHPQNLFRLVSRNTWENAHVESLFRIDADNFSTSPNRNASNGLLLMTRYKMGGDTLYYIGIRVDGYVVIKKKYNGAYYTMAQKKIFPGTYVLGGTVNLLPHNAWLTLGADTVTNANGSVTVRLLLKQPGETTATKVLEVTDSGQFGGSAPIIGSGYVGIRTDFMDVSFDNFKAFRI